MISQTSFHGSGNVVNNSSLIPGAVGYEIEEFCLVLLSVTGLVSVENLVNGHTQRIGDPHNGFQAGVFDACFNVAYVGNRHPGKLCQIRLGQFLQLPAPLQYL